MIKIDSVLYMIRNIVTGDGEQTRIEEQQWRDEIDDLWMRDILDFYLSEDLKQYDEACVAFIVYGITELGRDTLVKAIPLFIKDWIEDQEIDDELEAADERDFLMSAFRYHGLYEEEE